jgi:ribosome biogenesis GTPase A
LRAQRNAAIRPENEFMSTSIQWFPGHMHLTRKAIAERIGEIDVVIELLDARLPGSSANPMLQALASGKPTLKLLNKQDLADPLQTQAWLAHYNAVAGTQALGLDASVSAPLAHITRACQALAPTRGSMVKPLRVLIAGVPNVGKSTLINTLTARRAAKTGDEAGVTRLTQRIVLADGFYLFDTPGVLWPRIAVPQSGYNLAASGAIGKNAYQEIDVALSLLGYLKTHYAALVEARYAVASVAALADEDLLDAIGRKRAALQSGNRVNLQKAAEIVIHDLRSGVLGRITLESPAEFLGWKAAAELADASRATSKKGRSRTIAG